MTLQGAEIRLLFLYAQSKWNFKTVSLSDPARPPFVALSYVWGDPSDTLPLDVGEQVFQATRNLHNILDRLIESRLNQPLWIDALCINQQDQDERASQVAMMGDIYSDAEYVLAFLSPESEPFDIGLDYIESTARDTRIHFDPSLSPHLTVQGLNASDERLRDSLVAFFAAPWWTRVWTVQEFLLARKVIFRCGDRLIDAATVQKTCRAWIDHENSCCWAARRPIDGTAHGFLDIPSKTSGGFTIYTATLRMKHLMDMLIPRKLYTEDFLAAISLFRVRHCSNPRDRAFGYFGLRSPGLEVKHEIPIDYNVSVADLYRSLAVVLIAKSQTLDVLSHVLHETQVEGRTSGLPSWVPDWDATIDDRYHLTYTERTNTIRHCRASGDMKPDWKVQDSGSVITLGLQIAVIQETAPGYPSISPGSTSRGKTVINEWRRLAGLPAFANSSPLDKPSDSQRERAFENALSGGFPSIKWPQGSREYGKAYEAWLEWFVSSQVALSKSCKEVVQEFDELVRQTSERRRFIVTSDGQIGFGPEEAERGDVVVIIPGGKVPYVLRTVEDFESGVEKYRLLGDAFINGVMAGEKTSTSTSDFTWTVVV
ncbi:hypothetical protein NW752_006979 [Fusarium irregulare]|uniref:Heterokaryon incompatibility domain-containing protein n=1 Tax=Fusarium irregulare TaxID=2494466 RepID=A0A9W8PRD9_9HYPO|nr:hypothetical protein NW766_005863 [Fusarium irregulare]KAJ4016045.1 hypothetical protein NW752_006979 [Fusarium irregulare]